MAKVEDLTIEELKYSIEQKLLELLGDPDSGLELRREFKKELKKRLSSPSRRISHKEVITKFGQG